MAFMARVLHSKTMDDKLMHVPIFKKNKPFSRKKYIYAKIPNQALIKVSKVIKPKNEGKGIKIIAMPLEVKKIVCKIRYVLSEPRKYWGKIQVKINLRVIIQSLPYFAYKIK